MKSDLLLLKSFSQDNVNTSGLIESFESSITFDNAFNNHDGIDIDLKTLKCFSRSPSYDHTEVNYLITKNRFYLNIKKCLKSNYNDIMKNFYNQDEKKLEIKNFDYDDLYLTTSCIYDAKNKETYSLNDLSDDLKIFVNKILRLEMESKKNINQNWDLSFSDCLHSKNINQQSDSKISNLKLCTSCEISNNLWICITCGNVGCSRKQFGTDISGNSHALDHFTKTNHPIVVKIGSLSSIEEKCDAFCYICNDEIIVKDLSKFLLNFNINLQNVVKTEKNLTELNIYQNVNWDFNLSDSDGKKLEPIFGEGLTGMVNLGNSCYLNSIVQSLFNLKCFHNHFNKQAINFGLNPENDLTIQLHKLGHGLLSGKYSEKGHLETDIYQVGIRPSMFKSLISQDHEEFKSNKQQDAFEFLLHLFLMMEKKISTDITDDFRFLISTQIQCSNCLNLKVNVEIQDNICLEFGDINTMNNINLMDMFDKYCSNEIISEYKCDKCHIDSTTAVKKTVFKSFPKYFIVCVQRIQIENFKPVKIMNRIDIPYNLDLSKFKDELTDSDKKILKKKDKKDFIPNKNSLDQLISLGFSRNKSLKALFNTGNDNVEKAYDWIFQHSDDPDIDDLTEFQIKYTDSDYENLSLDLIEQLCLMGFDKELAKQSLLINNEDLNLSIDWLFKKLNNSSEKKVAKDVLQQLNIDSNTKFNLSSVVCHKGSSINVGHYVTFAKKKNKFFSDWVLLNDEKVVKCNLNSLKDVELYSYIYFFESSFLIN